MTQTPINHGVIPGRLPNDWIAGAIPYENRNPSGNWYGHLVVGEKQYFSNFDTMACVSFAVDNTGEIQIKAQTGIERNFADRFLAKASGTTMQGNYVSKVLDTFKKLGNVDEPIWPKPAEPTTWENYYSEIPKSVMDQALQTTLQYDLQYEYIPDHSAATVQHHLTHAPLLVTIPGHEITAIALEGNMLTVLDDYIFNVDPNQPFVRKIKLSDVTDIYKAVLTVKGNKPMLQLVNDAGTTYLVGPKGKIGIADPASEALMKQLDDVVPGSTKGIPQKGTLAHDDAYIIHQ